jgi:hypothetical protein
MFTSYASLYRISGRSHIACLDSNAAKITSSRINNLSSFLEQLPYVVEVKCLLYFKHEARHNAYNFPFVNKTNLLRNKRR